MKRFLRVRANTRDAQEPAWKMSMQKFQSMGSFTEDVNRNENGRNQMKRHLQSSHLLHSAIQQDITVPLIYLFLNTALLLSLELSINYFSGQNFCFPENSLLWRPDLAWLCSHKHREGLKICGDMTRV